MALTVVLVWSVLWLLNSLLPPRYTQKVGQMSIFPPETVTDILNTVGAALPDNAKQQLLIDVEYRLRWVVREAQKFQLNSKHQTLQPVHINAALKSLHYEPISGSSGAWMRAAVGGHGVHFLADATIDLTRLLQQPLPSVPHASVFSCHWLAIDGVMPRIVQNPTPATTAHQVSSAPAVQNIKQILTKELQMYYDFIIDKIHTDVDAAITSLEADPGIQGLMPYFCKYIVDAFKGVSMSQGGRIATCWAMMRFCRALLTNPDLFCEPYLHQLVPVVLTCIMTKNLGQEDEQDKTDDETKADKRKRNDDREKRKRGGAHRLREYACGLLKHMCREYGQVYQTLEPRVTKSLLRGLLDPEKSLECAYGALEGLCELVGDQG